MDGLATKGNSKTTNFTGLSSEVSLLRGWTLFVPHRPVESRMMWCFPKIFAEFLEEPFSLLGQGSRRGLGYGGFHNRCDAHTNTLTEILDIKWNIFGGLTS
jgi:hypothetical protein